MTVIFELDAYRLWRNTVCANMNFICQSFRKLSSDRHTYRHTDIQTRPNLYTTPLRGWSTKYTGISATFYTVAMATVHQCSLELLPSHAIFSRAGLIWLHYVPIFERFASHRGQTCENDENVISATNDCFEQLDESFIVDDVNALEHHWKNVLHLMETTMYVVKPAVAVCSLCSHCWSVLVYRLRFYRDLAC